MADSKLWLSIHALIKPELTAVKGHLALWKNGVHHRDVSASNLMYQDGAENPVGILNDSDLAAITQGSRRKERTGTVPFMAISLLAEGQAGQIKHIYAYDAESFVWVLIWVCACYDQGVLRRNPPLNAWLKVDARGCAEKKFYYLSYRSNAITPGGGHEKNWLIAQACLDALRRHGPFQTPDETCDGPFQKFLVGPCTASRQSDE